MAYFNHSPEQEGHNPLPRHFDGPVSEDWENQAFEDDASYPDDADDDMDNYDDYDDYDDYDEPDMTDEERREARQGRFRVAAGVSDFFGVIAGMVVILVLIALLVSLITWLQADISQTFTLWQTKL